MTAVVAVFQIPSMPVEMPDSMKSGRLDVQFGSWDVIPAVSDSKAGFISDVIPPSDYKGSAKIRYLPHNRPASYTW